MNLKKVFQSTVAAASLLAVVGTASADINIYGASAQFNFWTGNAVDFLNNIPGCGGAALVATSADGKDAAYVATCNGQPEYLRVGSKASYDGVCALNNNFVNVAPYGPAGNPNCTPGCDGDNHKRLMMNSNGSGVNQCVTVNVAAADISPECINQASQGQLKGPLCGGNISRDFLSAPISATSQACSPLAVPFAYFANKSVTYNNGANVISNITSMQAKLIFSGAIYDWSSLILPNLTRYDAKPIQVCLRHAGSGTLSTLDKMEISPFTLINAEALSDATCPGATVGAPTGPNFFFNDGSSDEMKCINGSGSWTGTGAIGYADADQSLSSYGNTVRLTVNGYAPSRQTIAMNEYFFWSMQKLYFGTGDANLSHVCTYVSDPTKITNQLWTPACMMEYERASACSPVASPVTPSCPGPWN